MVTSAVSVKVNHDPNAAKVLSVAILPDFEERVVLTCFVQIPDGYVVAAFP